MAIKSAYRTKANDQVFCFNQEGVHLPKYDGKFAHVRDEVLANLARNAEFFISTTGLGNFTRVTKEQWLSYNPGVD